MFIASAPDQFEHIFLDHIKHIKTHFPLFSGPGHSGLTESKVQVIENFSKYWYQKKCLREKDIPWEFKDPPRSSKLAWYDPRDTLLLTTN